MTTLFQVNAMLKALASRAMFKPRHICLIFHRVFRVNDPMCPGEPLEDWFADLIGTISRYFTIISLEKAISLSKNAALPGRTLSISFDDGYADNFEVALPILEHYRAPATFFVASGFIDGGCMWNDTIIESFRRLESGNHEIDTDSSGQVNIDGWQSRRSAAETAISAWKHLHPKERQNRVDDLSGRVSELPSNLMMTSEQLRALASSPYATVGAHTRNHPILSAISNDEAEAEIVTGKEDLEDLLQQEVNLFAYPNGKLGKDYMPVHSEIVKRARFDAAVATDWGVLTADTDLFAIPRFTPWNRNLSRFVVDLARCHHGLI